MSLNYTRMAKAGALFLARGNIWCVATLLFVAAKYLRDIPGMVDLPTEDEDVFVDVWTIDGFVAKSSPSAAR